MKLIRSELNIIGTQLNNFYYANSPASLASAEKRLVHLQEKFLPHAPEARRRVLETEFTIAQASANQERISKVQQELASLPPQRSAPAQTIYPTLQTVKTFFNEDNEAYFS